MGQGHVVDEDLFAIETISSHTQFLMNKPPERPFNPVVHPVANERSIEDADMELCNKQRYTVYSDEDKSRFFHLFSAAHRWVKRYYEDPKSIFEKKKKSGRGRVLGEEHKAFLLNCIDECRVWSLMMSLLLISVQPTSDYTINSRINDLPGLVYKVSDIVKVLDIFERVCVCAAHPETIKHGCAPTLPMANIQLYHN